MKRKSDELEVGTKSASERQLRAAAKAAVKKAGPARVIERDASEVAADKTRQADELREKAHEERNRAET